MDKNKPPLYVLIVSGFRRICLELADREGIDPFSTHAFRRTFATLPIENGAPSRLIQLAEGWKSISMLEQ